MPGETESGGSPGPATDRHNEPVVDPTANVIALNAAGFERQDILRSVEVRHVREILDMRSQCAEELNTLRTALVNEKFAGAERIAALVESHRIEQKGDSEKALTAALAAAEKAVAEQNKSATLSVDRAVAGMKEVIITNQQVNSATTNALGDKVEDLKANVSMLVNTRVSEREQRTEQRAITGGQVALIGLGSGLLFSVITLVITLFVR